MGQNDVLLKSEIIPPISFPLTISEKKNFNLLGPSIRLIRLKVDLKDQKLRHDQLDQGNVFF